MLSVSALLVAGIVVTQPETDSAGSPAGHVFYALRLIGALLVATAVPLLIDQRARRSNRVQR
ncbi:MAG: hypothetical protein M3P12_09675 [Gemmatimonadota bacterium]|nr:hypothetical protein [Gemmatimonadota bacterium]